MSVLIDSNNCIRCRACETNCVSRVFSHQDDGPMLMDDEKCIHCGHCFAVCPTGAITLDDHLPGSEPAVVSAPLNDTQRDMLFRGRRSVRDYASAPVPQEILFRALELANNAPTARNVREVHWTIFNGRDNVTPIVQEVAEVLSHTNTPYAQLLSAVKKGYDPILRGAPCLVLAHAKPWDWAEVDCAAAVTYMELALHSLGMGTCWCGFVIAALRSTGLLKSIPLAKDHKVYAGLMVGSPQTVFRTLAPRNKPNVQIID